MMTLGSFVRIVQLFEKFKPRQICSIFDKGINSLYTDRLLAPKPVLTSKPAEQQLFDEVAKERWRWQDKERVLLHFGLDHQAFTDLKVAVARKARKLDEEVQECEGGYRWWDGGGED